CQRKRQRRHLAGGRGFMLACQNSRVSKQKWESDLMAMGVGVLDHFNIRTRKLGDTVRFYEDVLGLENGARPNFAFPGAWMYSEGRAVGHLVDISQTGEPQKPDSGGVPSPPFPRPASRRSRIPAWSITSPSSPAALTG